ncbi:hypothetical protein ISCGN_013386 [Ixodes scapularis]
MFLADVATTRAEKERRLSGLAEGNAAEMTVVLETPTVSPVVSMPQSTEMFRESTALVAAFAPALQSMQRETPPPKTLIRIPVPEYSGQSDRALSATDFLLEIQRYRKATGLTEKETLGRVLPVALVGPAARWHHLVGESAGTLDEFTALFRQEFLPAGYLPRMRRELEERTQAPAEPFGEYLRAVQELLQIADPNATNQEQSAQKLLKYFAQEFGKLYGEMQLVYNVHTLSHLAEQCLDHGALGTFSAFPFESYLGKIKKLRSSSKPLSQLSRRILQNLARRVCASQLRSTSCGKVLPLSRTGSLLALVAGCKAFRAVFVPVNSEVPAAARCFHRAELVPCSPSWQAAKLSVQCLCQQAAKLSVQCLCQSTQKCQLRQGASIEPNWFLARPRGRLQSFPCSVCASQLRSASCGKVLPSSRTGSLLALVAGCKAFPAVFVPGNSEVPAAARCFHRAELVPCSPSWQAAKLSVQCLCQATQKCQLRQGASIEPNWFPARPRSRLQSFPCSVCARQLRSASCGKVLPSSRTGFLLALVAGCKAFRAVFVPGNSEVPAAARCFHRAELVPCSRSWQAAKLSVQRLCQSTQRCQLRQGASIEPNWFPARPRSRLQSFPCSVCARQLRSASCGKVLPSRRTGFLLALVAGCKAFRAVFVPGNSEVPAAARCFHRAELVPCSPSWQAAKLSVQCLCQATQKCQLRQGASIEPNWFPARPRSRLQSFPCSVCARQLRSASCGKVLPSSRTGSLLALVAGCKAFRAVFVPGNSEVPAAARQLRSASCGKVLPSSRTGFLLALVAGCKAFRAVFVPGNSEVPAAARCFHRAELVSCSPSWQAAKLSVQCLCQATQKCQLRQGASIEPNWFPARPRSRLQSFPCSVCARQLRSASCGKVLPSSRTGFLLALVAGCKAFRAVFVPGNSEVPAAARCFHRAELVSCSPSWQAAKLSVQCLCQATQKCQLRQGASIEPNWFPARPRSRLQSFPCSVCARQLRSASCGKVLPSSRTGFLLALVAGCKAFRAVFVPGNSEVPAAARCFHRAELVSCSPSWQAAKLSVQCLCQATQKCQLRQGASIEPNWFPARPRGRLQSFPCSVCARQLRSASCGKVLPSSRTGSLLALVAGCKAFRAVFVPGNSEVPAAARCFHRAELVPCSPSWQAAKLSVQCLCQATQKCQLRQGASIEPNWFPARPRSRLQSFPCSVCARQLRSASCGKVLPSSRTGFLLALVAGCKAFRAVFVPGNSEVPAAARQLRSASCGKVLPSSRTGFLLALVAGCKAFRAVFVPGNSEVPAAARCFHRAELVSCSPSWQAAKLSVQCLCQATQKCQLRQGASIEPNWFPARPRSRLQSFPCSVCARQLRSASCGKVLPSSRTGFLLALVAGCKAFRAVFVPGNSEVPAAARCFHRAELVSCSPSWQAAKLSVQCLCQATQKCQLRQGASIEPNWFPARPRGRLQSFPCSVCARQLRSASCGKVLPSSRTGFLLALVAGCKAFRAVFVPGNSEVPAAARCFHRAELVSCSPSWQAAKLSVQCLCQATQKCQLRQGASIEPNWFPARPRGRLQSFPCSVCARQLRSASCGKVLPSSRTGSLLALVAGCKAFRAVFVPGNSEVPAAARCFHRAELVSCSPSWQAAKLSVQCLCQATQKCQLRQGASIEPNWFPARPRGRLQSFPCSVCARQLRSASCGKVLPSSRTGFLLALVAGCKAFRAVFVPGNSEVPAAARCFHRAELVPCSPSWQAAKLSVQCLCQATQKCQLRQGASIEPNWFPARPRGRLQSFPCSVCARQLRSASCGKVLPSSRTGSLLALVAGCKAFRAVFVPGNSEVPAAARCFHRAELVSCSPSWQAAKLSVQCLCQATQKCQLRQGASIEPNWFPARPRSRLQSFPCSVCARQLRSASCGKVLPSSRTGFLLALVAGCKAFRAVFVPGNSEVPAAARQLRSASCGKVLPSSRTGFLLALVAGCKAFRAVFVPGNSEVPAAARCFHRAELVSCSPSWQAAKLSVQCLCQATQKCQLRQGASIEPNWFPARPRSRLQSFPCSVCARQLRSASCGKVLPSSRTGFLLALVAGCKAFRAVFVPGNSEVPAAARCFHRAELVSCSPSWQAAKLSVQCLCQATQKCQLRQGASIEPNWFPARPRSRLQSFPCSVCARQLRSASCGKVLPSSRTGFLLALVAGCKAFRAVFVPGNSEVPAAARQLRSASCGKVLPSSRTGFLLALVAGCKAFRAVFVPGNSEVPAAARCFHRAELVSCSPSWQAAKLSVQCLCQATQKCQLRQGASIEPNWFPARPRSRLQSFPCSVCARQLRSASCGKVLPSSRTGFLLALVAGCKAFRAVFVPGNSEVPAAARCFHRAELVPCSPSWQAAKLSVQCLCQATQKCQLRQGASIEPNWFPARPRSRLQSFPCSVCARQLRSASCGKVLPSSRTGFLLALVAGCKAFRAVFVPGNSEVPAAARQLRSASCGKVLPSSRTGSLLALVAGCKAFRAVFVPGNSEVPAAARCFHRAELVPCSPSWQAAKLSVQCLCQATQKCQLRQGASIEPNWFPARPRGRLQSFPCSVCARQLRSASCGKVLPSSRTGFLLALVAGCKAFRAVFVPGNSEVPAAARCFHRAELVSCSPSWQAAKLSVQCLCQATQKCQLRQGASIEPNWFLLALVAGCKAFRAVFVPGNSEVPAAARCFHRAELVPCSPSWQAAKLSVQCLCQATQKCQLRQGASIEPNWFPARPRGRLQSFPCSVCARQLRSASCGKVLPSSRTGSLLALVAGCKAFRAVFVPGNSEVPAAARQLRSASCGKVLPSSRTGFLLALVAGCKAFRAVFVPGNSEVPAAARQLRSASCGKVLPSSRTGFLLALVAGCKAFRAVFVPGNSEVPAAARCFHRAELVPCSPSWQAAKLSVQCLCQATQKCQLRQGASIEPNWFPARPRSRLQSFPCSVCARQLRSASCGKVLPSSRTGFLLALVAGCKAFRAVFVPGNSEVPAAARCFHRAELVSCSPSWQAAKLSVQCLCQATQKCQLRQGASIEPNWFPARPRSRLQSFPCSVCARQLRSASCGKVLPSSRTGFLLALVAGCKAFRAVFVPGNSEVPAAARCFHRAELVSCSPSWQAAKLSVQCLCQATQKCQLRQGASIEPNWFPARPRSRLQSFPCSVCARQLRSASCGKVLPSSRTGFLLALVAGCKAFRAVFVPGNSEVPAAARCFHRAELVSCSPSWQAAKLSVQCLCQATQKCQLRQGASIEPNWFPARPRSRLQSFPCSVCARQLRSASCGKVLPSSRTGFLLALVAGCKAFRAVFVPGNSEVPAAARCFHRAELVSCSPSWQAAKLSVQCLCQATQKCQLRQGASIEPNWFPARPRGRLQSFPCSVCARQLRSASCGKVLPSSRTGFLLALVAGCKAFRAVFVPGNSEVPAAARCFHRAELVPCSPSWQAAKLSVQCLCQATQKCQLRQGASIEPNWFPARPRGRLQSFPCSVCARQLRSASCGKVLPSSRTGFLLALVAGCKAFRAVFVPGNSEVPAAARQLRSASCGKVLPSSRTGSLLALVAGCKAFRAVFVPGNSEVPAAARCFHRAELVSCSPSWQAAKLSVQCLCQATQKCQLRQGASIEPNWFPARPRSRLQSFPCSVCARQLRSASCGKVLPSSRTGFLLALVAGCKAFRAVFVPGNSEVPAAARCFHRAELVPCSPSWQAAKLSVQCLCQATQKCQLRQGASIEPNWFPARPRSRLQSFPCSVCARQLRSASCGKVLPSSRTGFLLALVAGCKAFRAVFVPGNSEVPAAARQLRSASCGKVLPSSRTGFLLALVAGCKAFRAVFVPGNSEVPAAARCFHRAELVSCSPSWQAAKLSVQCLCQATQKCQLRQGASIEPNWFPARPRSRLQSFPCSVCARQLRSASCGKVLPSSRTGFLLALVAGCKAFRAVFVPGNSEVPAAARCFHRAELVSCSPSWQAAKLSVQCLCQATQKCQLRQGASIEPNWFPARPRGRLQSFPCSVCARQLRSASCGKVLPSSRTGFLLALVAGCKAFRAVFVPGNSEVPAAARCFHRAELVPCSPSWQAAKLSVQCLCQATQKCQLRQGASIEPNWFPARPRSRLQSFPCSVCARQLRSASCGKVLPSSRTGFLLALVAGCKAFRAVFVPGNSEVPAAARCFHRAELVSCSPSWQAAKLSVQCLCQATQKCQLRQGASIEPNWFPARPRGRLQSFPCSVCARQLRSASCGKVLPSSRTGSLLALVAGCKAFRAVFVPGNSEVPAAARCFHRAELVPCSPSWQAAKLSVQCLCQATQKCQLRQGASIEPNWFPARPRSRLQSFPCSVCARQLRSASCGKVLPSSRTGFLLALVAGCKAFRAVFVPGNSEVPAAARQLRSASCGKVLPSSRTGFLLALVAGCKAFRAVFVPGNSEVPAAARCFHRAELVPCSPSWQAAKLSVQCLCQATQKCQLRQGASIEPNWFPARPRGRLQSFPCSVCARQLRSASCGKVLPSSRTGSLLALVAGCKAFRAVFVPGNSEVPAAARCFHRAELVPCSPSWQAAKLSVQCLCQATQKCQLRQGASIEPNWFPARPRSRLQSFPCSVCARQLRSASCGKVLPSSRTGFLLALVAGCKAFRAVFVPGNSEVPAAARQLRSASCGKVLPSSRTGSLLALVAGCKAFRAVFVPGNSEVPAAARCFHRAELVPCSPSWQAAKLSVQCLCQATQKCQLRQGASIEPNWFPARPRSRLQSFPCSVCARQLRSASCGKVLPSSRTGFLLALVAGCKAFRAVFVPGNSEVPAAVRCFHRAELVPCSPSWQAAKLSVQCLCQATQKCQLRQGASIEPNWFPARPRGRLQSFPCSVCARQLRSASCGKVLPSSRTGFLLALVAGCKAFRAVFVPGNSEVPAAARQLRSASCGKVLPSSRTGSLLALVAGCKAFRAVFVPGNSEVPAAVRCFHRAELVPCSPSWQAAKLSVQCLCQATQKCQLRQGASIEPNWFPARPRSRLQSFPCSVCARQLRSASCGKVLPSSRTGSLLALVAGCKAFRAVFVPGNSEVPAAVRCFHRAELVPCSPSEQAAKLSVQCLCQSTQKCQLRQGASIEPNWFPARPRGRLQSFPCSVCARQLRSASCGKVLPSSRTGSLLALVAGCKAFRAVFVPGNSEVPAAARCFHRAELVPCSPSWQAAKLSVQCLCQSTQKCQLRQGASIEPNWFPARPRSRLQSFPCSVCARQLRSASCGKVLPSSRTGFLLALVAGCKAFRAVFVPGNSEVPAAARCFHRAELVPCSPSWQAAKLSVQCLCQSTQKCQLRQGASIEPNWFPARPRSRLQSFPCSVCARQLRSASCGKVLPSSRTGSLLALVAGCKAFRAVFVPGNSEVPAAARCFHRAELVPCSPSWQAAKLSVQCLCQSTQKCQLRQGASIEPKWFPARPRGRLQSFPCSVVNSEVPAAVRCFHRAELVSYSLSWQAARVSVWCLCQSAQRCQLQQDSSTKANRSTACSKGLY